MDGTQSACGNTATPGTIFFLHERVSKTGVRRLVVIEGTTSVAGLLPLVIEPASGLALPKAAVPAVDLRFDLHFSPDVWQQAHRIDSGQIDPADPSHFTIAFQAGNGRGAIYGKLDASLSDDGNGMKVRINTPTAWAREKMTGKVRYSSVSGTYSGSARFDYIRIAAGALPISGAVNFTGTAPMPTGLLPIATAATTAPVLNMSLNFSGLNLTSENFDTQLGKALSPAISGASGSLVPTTAPFPAGFGQLRGDVEIMPLTQPPAAPQTRPNAPDIGTEQ